MKGSMNWYDVSRSISGVTRWALVIIVAATGLMIIGKTLAGVVNTSAPSAVIQGLGFLLIVGWCTGLLAERMGLPRLTGYIVAGLLVGPSVIGILESDIVENLGPLDDLASTFIALVAGGELRLALLRGHWRSIFAWIGGQSLAVPLVVIGGIFLAAPVVPGLPAGGSRLLAAAVVIAAISLARSPAATVAVIDESNARGPFTETVLAVTIAMDTLVILLFGGAMSFAGMLVTPGAAFNGGIFLGLGAEIGLSIVMGVLVGFLVILAVRVMHLDLPVLLAALAFLITRLSREISSVLEHRWDVHLHLEPLLVALTAGIVVQNLSRRGEAFTEALERIAPPIYVIFFGLAGASLDLGALRSSWILVLLLIGLRAFGLYFGSWIGAAAARDEPAWRWLAGWTSMSQAGVSLGLAAEVARRYPEWGPSVSTPLVAVIAVNQLMGPALLDRALRKSGETHPDKLDA